LFSDEYAYFSSYSQSWLAHAREYVTRMIEKLSLTRESRVVEIACNDGYLLQYVKAREIPCLGIEPTASTAAAATRKGIQVCEEFFGEELAGRLVADGYSADLITANNVLAHVPDINDFVSGVGVLLKPTGVATFEFPHLLNLVRDTQFDTIYHEHYSYFSLHAVKRILERSGLVLFDVEQLSTHGGSLRLYAHRSDGVSREVSQSVSRVLVDEHRAGVTTVDFYSGFQEKVDAVRNEFVEFLVSTRRSGKTVAAYGAAAKGSTLMNYARVGRDLIRFVADQNPSKQGKFMPGSHVPIVACDYLDRARPDYVVIFPWNLRDEISAQLSGLSSSGTELLTAVPRLRFLRESER
jgi:predicted TPR repeat methyltransferase